MQWISVCLLSVAHGWDWTNMGSKSPYLPQQDPATYTTPPPQCSTTPVHADLLARHGLRYATKGNVKTMSTLATKLSTLNLTGAPAFLKTWKNPVATANQDMLAPAGELEHYHMGQRLRANYPSLLTIPYNPNFYAYASTFLARTAQSGVANHMGTWEGTGGVGNSSTFPPVFLYTHANPGDISFRFFDNCPFYTTAMATTNAQIDTWCRANLAGIVSQLQTEINPAITYDDMQTMYGACGMENTLNGDTSKMCSLFNDTAMELLILCDGLDSYFNKGPGLPLSYQISAPAIADIVMSMQAFVAAGGPGKGNPLNMRFVHAETISPVAAYMGLFAGGPAIDLANPDPSQYFNRSWNDNQIIPYSANMLFLMYNCTDGYRVKMLYNEKETVLPQCGTMYCNYSDFLRLYNDTLSYDYYGVCNPTYSPTRTPTQSPSTKFPSQSPSTKSPSQAPTTPAPSAAPTTCECPQCPQTAVSSASTFSFPIAVASVLLLAAA